MLSQLARANRSLIRRTLATATTTPAQSTEGIAGTSSFKVLNHTTGDKPHVVVLGSGWGAISFLQHIDATKYNVTMVSPRNYFLFTPLLPSTPVGTVDEKSIIEPVVNFALKKKGNVVYYEAEATAVNPDRNTITIKSVSNVINSEKELGLNHNETAEIKYDYLVSAVGAEPNTFGIPGVEEHGLFLKEIPDSLAIRKKFLENIEKANLLPKDSAERKRLLTIVVVGGGPTGVETAGELADYIHEDLHKFMPSIASEIKIHLVEALPVVLNMFEKRLTSYAGKILEQTNINLMLRTAVAKVEPTQLMAKTKHEDGSVTEETIPYGTLIWATGNKPRKIVRDLITKIPAQEGSVRGLTVNDHMLVKGTNNIFAIGDNAFAKLAPTAQVAHQQAEYLCKMFTKLPPALPEAKADVALEKLYPAFKYVHLGALAYLGSEKAIANITYGPRNLYTGGGVLTFWIWKVVYLGMVLSWRSRWRIISDWVGTAIFRRDVFKGL